MPWASNWYLIGTGGTVVAPPTNEPSSGSALPVNAILTFQVPTGAREIDDLGNPKAVLQPLVVKAYLVKKRGRSQGGDIATDRHEITLEGRCIDPPALPSALVAGSKAEGTIGDLQGTFELSAAAQSPFKAVTTALGAKLKGTFSSRVVWGNSDV